MFEDGVGEDRPLEESGQDVAQEDQRSADGEGHHASVVGGLRIEQRHLRGRKSEHCRKRKQREKTTQHEHDFDEKTGAQCFDFIKIVSVFLHTSGVPTQAHHEGRDEHQGEGGDQHDGQRARTRTGVGENGRINRGKSVWAHRCVAKVGPIHGVPNTLSQGFSAVDVGHVSNQTGNATK